MAELFGCGCRPQARPPPKPMFATTTVVEPPALARPSGRIIPTARAEPLRQARCRGLLAGLPLLGHRLTDVAKASPTTRTNPRGDRARRAPGGRRGWTASRSTGTTGTTSQTPTSTAPTSVCSGGSTPSQGQRRRHPLQAAAGVQEREPPHHRQDDKRPHYFWVVTAATPPSTTIPSKPELVWPGAGSTRTLRRPPSRKRFARGSTDRGDKNMGLDSRPASMATPGTGRPRSIRQPPVIRSDSRPGGSVRSTANPTVTKGLARAAGPGYNPSFSTAAAPAFRETTGERRDSRRTRAVAARRLAAHLLNEIAEGSYIVRLRAGQLPYLDGRASPVTLRPFSGEGPR